MRRFNILFAFAAILLSSCINDEVDYIGFQPSSKGGIHIVGAVEDYDIKSVGTRADDGDIADSYISEMTMFIFKSNGDLIQGYTATDYNTECTSAINIQRGNPTFLIDTEEGILADLSGTSDTSVVYYDNNASDLGACDIYIVANAWHQLSAPIEEGSTTRFVDNIKTLADLEAFVYNVDTTLAMPMIDTEHHRGFPMIGKQQGGTFKLKKGDDNEGNAVATIPLKKLYSKVRFTMQINADQVVAGQTPKFTISKVEVFNVPNKARLGRELDANGKPVYGTTNVDDYVTEMGVTGTYTPSDYYHFTESPFVIEKFNNKTISHSTSLTTDDIIEFGFYMPEHKVTPNTITYPANITDEAKQYYKPAGVGQSRNGDGSISAAKIATFVRIHGSYTDHNGQILGVTYDIYLGQNNSDDFTVKRNQLLNNKLIITGLTNHKDAYPDAEGNISIDHRVEVSDRGFNLSMERTAILDAHFEVRPLDIELQAGASMTVTIPEGYRDWVAMEDDAVAYNNTSGLYVNTSTARKGVRKYFTTDLVRELNNLDTYKDGNGGTIFFENKEETTQIFRIWFYIDENPNVYDKLGLGKQTSESGTYTVSKEQYRVCPVQFAYEYKKKDENGEVVEVITKTETINFQQWNLWRVWAKDDNGNPVRYYDIEHEEEYLNNYASDMQYGQTQNGMAWGLDGLQLSDEHEAIYFSGATSNNSTLDAILEWLGWDKKQTLEQSYALLTPKPKYDFYLPRDVSSEELYAREFAGYEMNCDIIEKLLTTHVADEKAKINDVILTENSKSAIAYCYNKNKRNSDGSVCTIQGDTLNTSNLKWYLPSIDEVEDIAKGAYDEFDRVFQGNLYWSCQPAFYQNKLVLNVYRYKVEWFTGSWYDSESDIICPFYEDNTERARATRAVVENNQFASNLPSGSLLYKEQEGNVYASALDFIGVKKDAHLTTHKIINANSHNENPGNLPRTVQKCRIRAVYRSGTK